MKQLLLILALLPSYLFSNDFQQGNIEFTNKNYTKAIEHYQHDIDKNGYSIETLYNLSNVYQKLDKNGYALLYLYKAQIIKPQDRSISQDIMKLKQSLEIEKQYKLLLPLSSIYIDYVPAISLFIVTILLIILIFFKKRVFHTLFKVILTISILSLLLGISLTVYKNGKSNDGIILEDSSVKLSPYENSDTTFTIKETNIVSVSDEFEDYYYILDRNERFGWIKKDRIGQIWK